MLIVELLVIPSLENIVYHSNHQEFIRLVSTNLPERDGRLERTL